ncbi:response regulator transcription factor [Actinomycetospora corticicola]|uniref:DNA-binding NarL/FixJ family response regulator n=1 Tax=Actinomycetospora corticicola TaxID=663602 RepID=A0A7Y9J7M7_9PSEU|nr:response regulator transcription factor [Actinomycetospora corticicola]NYD38181.1 DNA-binding NarL/FixJ family response regulator [Actinomycetospora corticicola]
MTGAGATRVMVVDDHPMWREGVARDLTERGFDVVATAGDGAAAVRIAPAARPDVVVMDLQMPHLDGAGATAAILAALPGTRVLVLSASAEQGDVLGAVRAGAAGYLLKSAQAAELVDAVQRTADGQAVFGPELAGLVLGEFRRREKRKDRETQPSGEPALTPRETEVLRLVAKGLTARQIAERLTLSHRTVENHVQNALRKLQLTNRVELTRYAIEQGLDQVASPGEQ